MGNPFVSKYDPNDKLTKCAKVVSELLVKELSKYNVKDCDRTLVQDFKINTQNIEFPLHELTVSGTLVVISKVGRIELNFKISGNEYFEDLKEGILNV